MNLVERMREQAKERGVLSTPLFLEAAAEIERLEKEIQAAIRDLQDFVHGRIDEPVDLAQRLIDNLTTAIEEAGGAAALRGEVNP